MGIFERAKRVAKANLGSALGRFRKPDPDVIEAEQDLDQELDDSDIDVTDKDRDLRRAYRRLELPFGASKRRIERSFRRLASRYHPDRFAADPDRAKLAEAVMQILTDARKTLLEAWRKGRIRNKTGT